MKGFFLYFTKLTLVNATLRCLKDGPHNSVKRRIAVLVSESQPDTSKLANFGGLCSAAFKNAASVI